MFLVAIAVYLVLRLWMATLPGYANDVQSYKCWALGSALAGIGEAYEASGVDYPPLFIYALYPSARLYLAVGPEVPDDRALLRDDCFRFLEPVDSTLLTVLIKLPHLFFDLLLAALLFHLVRSGGTWGALRGREWGRLAALVYLWNPAVLWGSAYWGQPDGVHSALVVGALALLTLHRNAGAGGLLAAAGLMKPLAAPIVPWFIVSSAVRSGAAGVGRAAAGGIAVGLLGFLPFFLSGRILPVLRRVLVDVEAMPFTSVNAHNLWWILGPWKPADLPVFLGLTPKVLGLMMFLAAYAALLVVGLQRLRRVDRGSEDERALVLLVAAAVTCAFFFLSTHMHENHLFMAVPLLLTVAGRSRELAWLAAGCSLAVFLNMALHDLDLPSRLPWVLGRLSTVHDPHLGRPFTWGQFVGSFLNAALVCVVCVRTYIAALRGRI